MGDAGAESEQAKPNGELTISFLGGVLDRSPGDGEFWVGRDRDCVIRVADGQVSGRHVRVLPRRTDTGFEWGVEDHSRYGTWVDGGRTRLEKGAIWWFSRDVELRLADEVHGPRVWLTAVVDQTSTPTGLSSWVPELSSSEREVLAGIRAGLSDKELARRLHIAPKSASTRVERLRDKLEEFEPTHKRLSRVELAEVARELRIEAMSK